MEYEEDIACKFCKRCVLAGPICCIDAATDLYDKSIGEVMWYRKLHSIKDKKIFELEYQIKVLKGQI
jgi:hypothetical protein